MAIRHYFNNKTYILPGAYAANKTELSVPNTTVSYSKALIIDTAAQTTSDRGPLGFHSSGPGVLGELSQAKDSILHFRSETEMKAFFKGGLLWKAAEGLFNPSNITGTTGISDLYYINAKTTTAAKVTVAGIQIAVRDEGISGNGIATGAPSDADVALSQGYGAKIDADVSQSGKFVLKIYAGSFTGINADDGLPYDEVPANRAYPNLILQSPAFAQKQDLINWALKDSDFNLGFKCLTTTASGALTTAAFTVAAGGTETASAAAVTAALEAAKCLDISFILSDKFGTNASNALNTQLEGFARSSSRFRCYVFIGGGNTRSDWTFSKTTAQALDSEYAILVHGGCKKISSSFPRTFRNWNSFITASYLLGRIAGVYPQVPPTFKEINLQGLQHDMNEIEQEEAIEFGVLVPIYDYDLERYDILMGVNTYQDNDVIINADGSSCLIQARRSIDHVNKELIVAAKKELFSQRDGVTIMTLDIESFTQWIDAKLKQKVDRGLIAYYEDIKVERNQNAYYASFKLRIAYEIDLLFLLEF